MLIALITMSFLLPIFVISAFIFGFNINAQPNKKIALKRKERLSETDMIMKNLDAYDGTSFNQKEFKQWKN